MTANGFQVFVDAAGDLWIADGMVVAKADGTVHLTGQGDDEGAVFGDTAASLQEKTAAPMVMDLTLLGGSGRNVILSGLPAATPSPDGIYRPGRPDEFKREIWILTVTGPSAATLSDGTDVVAELTTGGTAPAGSFDSTTYGEDTYNSGSPFTLTAATETGFPGGLVDMDVTVLDGTAQGGLYTATDAASFTSDVNADWQIALNEDGTADLIYDGDVVAQRSGGPNDDPCGQYDSTELGKVFNPDLADDVALVTPDTVNPFGTLTLEFSWPSPQLDLDIGVSFAGVTVGYGYSAGSDFMSWSTDDTSAGPETVVVDLAAAWDAGEIGTVAEIMAMADWFPDAHGSGPATLTVTYDPPGGSGTPQVLTIHPSQTTPATTSVLAIRILQDGTSSFPGTAWQAKVRAIRRYPMEGVVYLELEETAGVLTSVGEPVFAATLPTSGGGTFYIPLATSDGTGKVKQIHSGTLTWG